MADFDMSRFDTDNYGEFVNALMDADRAGVPMDILLKKAKKLDTMPGTAEITVDFEDEEAAKQAYMIVRNTIRLFYAASSKNHGEVRGYDCIENDMRYDAYYDELVPRFENYDPCTEFEECPIERVTLFDTQICIEECKDLAGELGTFKIREKSISFFQLLCFILAAKFPDTPFEALQTNVSYARGLVEYTAALYFEKPQRLCFYQYGGGYGDCFRRSKYDLMNNCIPYRWKLQPDHSIRYYGEI